MDDFRRINKEKIIYILLLAVIISLFTSFKAMAKIMTFKDRAQKIMKKIVFFNFDDGPSENNTLRILNILNKHNVKASFVVGNKADSYPNIVRKIKKQWYVHIIS